ncbi:MarR family transcriptional regulator [Nocardioides sp. GY 10127]|nr:MarR family transcriptional regulator [Nocardioides sp. GY 10127]
MSLLTKVARLYHDEGVRQPEIAARLHISQSRVSRLLKEAVEIGVVRTVVVPPSGVHPDLEDAVRDAYGLADVVVAEATAPDDERSVTAAIGSAGAAYLESTLGAADRVGLSSWSSTLLACVDAMMPRTVRLASEISQVIGGVGQAAVQVQATQLTSDLARIAGATPRFLPAPGIVATAAVRDGLLSDPQIADLAASWADLTTCLVGIGSLEPSPLLAMSGNAVPEDERATLREAGAVGDVCLRFFDADGEQVDAGLADRVVGIDPATLKAIPRVIGLAGGRRKLDAVRAAALGGWVHVLITDVVTAEGLLARR